MQNDAAAAGRWQKSRPVARAFWVRFRCRRTMSPLRSEAGDLGSPRNKRPRFDALTGHWPVFALSIIFRAFPAGMPSAASRISGALEIPLPHPYY